MLHVASITIVKETELLCNYMSIPSLAVKSKMLIMLHFDLSVACLCILMLVCTMGLALNHNAVSTVLLSPDS